MEDKKYIRNVTIFGSKSVIGYWVALFLVIVVAYFLGLSSIEIIGIISMINILGFMMFFFRLLLPTKFVVVANNRALTIYTYYLWLFYEKFEVEMKTLEMINLRQYLGRGGGGYVLYFVTKNKETNTIWNHFFSKNLYFLSNWWWDYDSRADLKIFLNRYVMPYVK